MLQRCFASSSLELQLQVCEAPQMFCGLKKKHKTKNIWVKQRPSLTSQDTKKMCGRWSAPPFCLPARGVWETLHKMLCREISISYPLLRLITWRSQKHLSSHSVCFCLVSTSRQVKTPQDLSSVSAEIVAMSKVRKHWLISYTSRSQPVVWGPLMGLKSII